jgi:hypothetical protein
MVCFTGQVECQRDAEHPNRHRCQCSPSQARLGTGRDASPRRFSLTTQHKSILALSDEGILEQHHVVIIIITALLQRRRGGSDDEREGVLGEYSGRDIATRRTMEEL